MNRAKELLAEQILVGGSVFQNNGLPLLCREYLFAHTAPCRDCPIAKSTGAPFCARALWKAVRREFKEGSGDTVIRRHLDFLTALYHAQPLDLPEISDSEELLDAYADGHQIPIICRDVTAIQLFLAMENNTGVLRIIRTHGLKRAQAALPGSRVEPLTHALAKTHNISLVTAPRTA